MKQLLKYILSLSLMTPSFGLGSNEITPATPADANIDIDANLPQLTDVGWTNLSQLTNVLRAPPKINDRFHLIDQEIRYNNHSYYLHSIGEMPLRTTYDRLDYQIEGTHFVVRGMKGHDEVIRQTFRNLKVHSFVHDAEILALMTTDGQFHAIDMAFLASHIFKEPVPVYKNLLHSNHFKEPMNLDFWTRGLPPSLFAGMTEDQDKIYPHNRLGEIVFSGGDLILHRGPQGDSRAFSALSRQVIIQKMTERMEELVLKASLTSQEVFEKMDPKLLAQFENNANNKGQIRTLDEVAQMAIRAIPSSSVKKLIQTASNLTDSDRLYDKATLTDWVHTYNELVQLPQVQKDSLEGIQPNLSKNWQELIHSSSQYAINTIKRPGFIRRHAHALAYISGVATVGIPAAYLNVDTQMLFAVIDHLIENATPPILNVAEYRYPLLASISSLVAIIPLVQSFAWTSPHVMKMVGHSFKMSSERLSEKITNLSQVWKGLNNWQRIVTMGARIYSLVSVAFWNHIGTLLRQPQLFRTLKMGLNPFQNVPSNSDLGNIIGLQNDIKLGVNNPLLPAEELRANAMKQQEAIQYLAQDHLKARNAAFQLVALTLYSRQDIDPVTLALLLQKEAGSAIVDHSLLSDLTPQKQKEWATLTETIASEWLQTITSEGRMFSQISAVDFTEMLKHGEAIVQKYKKSGLLQKRLKIFKHEAGRALKKMQQDLLLLGVEDGHLLRTVYANNFVSEQVKKTFVSDHLLVVFLPALWGKRADPNMATVPGGNADGSDRNLLTFMPKDGNITNLWTNPEHMMDIWINVSAHFFAGGARQILLYQGAPVRREHNYEPAENFTHKQSHETEGSVRGTYEWVKNTVDTRQSELGNYYLRSLIRQIRTIQAGMILSLTFRFLTTDPAVDQAFLGWYYVFVAGTWAYAWPWIVIAQGNNLEEKRIEKNLGELNALQVELSQSLRLGELEAAQEKAHELLALYGRDESRLDNLLKEVGPMPESEDVEAMNKWSQKLLRYSWAVAPFATQKSPLPSWLSTWAGALSTTYLAIPLGVLSLDHSYLTLDNMIYETLISAGGFASAYYLIGREGLWSKMLEKMSWLTKKRRPPETIEAAPALSCKRSLSKSS